MPVERRKQLQCLAYLEPFGQLRLLQLSSEDLAKLTAIPLRMKSEDADIALVRLAEADDAFDQCRLAGSIRTNDSQDLALWDLEADVVDGQVSSVALAHV